MDRRAPRWWQAPEQVVGADPGAGEGPVEAPGGEHQIVEEPQSEAGRKRVHRPDVVQPHVGGGREEGVVVDLDATQRRSRLGADGARGNRQRELADAEVEAHDGVVRGSVGAEQGEAAGVADADVVLEHRAVLVVVDVEAAAVGAQPGHVEHDVALDHRGVGVEGPDAGVVLCAGPAGQVAAADDVAAQLGGDGPGGDDPVSARPRHGVPGDDDAGARRMPFAPGGRPRVDPAANHDDPTAMNIADPVALDHHVARGIVHLDPCAAIQPLALVAADVVHHEVAQHDVVGLGGADGDHVHAAARLGAVAAIGQIEAFDGDECRAGEGERVGRERIGGDPRPRATTVGADQDRSRGRPRAPGDERAATARTSAQEQPRAGTEDDPAHLRE